MKGKKPFLLAVLLVGLLAVALIVPAAVSAANDNKPDAWANWARGGQYEGFQVSVGGAWSGLLEYPWQAAFAVHAQLRLVDGGPDLAVGHEVMNWQSELAPPGTPPWKHNRTTDLLECDFIDLGDGSYRARLLFRYDTEELGWGEVYDYGGDVYHLWVLTDNPGNEMDHVDLYTKALPLDEAPELDDDPTEWGDGCPGATWAVDLDCRGVQVVIK